MDDVKARSRDTSTLIEHVVADSELRSARRMLEDVARLAVAAPQDEAHMFAFDEAMARYRSAMVAYRKATCQVLRVRRIPAQRERRA